MTSFSSSGQSCLMRMPLCDPTTFSPQDMVQCHGSNPASATDQLFDPSTNYSTITDFHIFICKVEITIVSTSQGHCADTWRQRVKAVVEVVEALRDLREGLIDNTSLHETLAAVRSTDHTACSPCFLFSRAIMPLSSIPNLRHSALDPRHMMKGWERDCPVW